MQLYEIEEEELMGAFKRLDDSPMPLMTHAGISNEDIIGVMGRIKKFDFYSFEFDL